MKVKVKSLSFVWLFANHLDCSLPGSLPWKFSRQEYWSGLPFPPPGDLPDPGIEPGSPSLQTDALPSEPLGKPVKNLKLLMNLIIFKGYLNSFLFVGVLNHRCLQNLMISVIHSCILNFSTALLKCNWCYLKLYLNYLELGIFLNIIHGPLCL